MNKFKLKNSIFEVIEVTGEAQQFSELKRFCGDFIKISYETCAIDDYWLIQVYDSFRKEFVVVHNYDYIVKLGEHTFIVIDRIEFDEYFEAIDNVK